MNYEVIEKQIAIATQLHSHGHAIHAFLLLYHLLRIHSVKEHYNTETPISHNHNHNNLKKKKNNNNNNNNENSDVCYVNTVLSECNNTYADANYCSKRKDVIDSTRDISNPCFADYLKREEVFVRTQAVHYLLSSFTSSSSQTKFDMTIISSFSNPIGKADGSATASIKSKQIKEQLNLALTLLLPMFAVDSLSERIEIKYWSSSGMYGNSINRNKSLADNRYNSNYKSKLLYDKLSEYSTATDDFNLSNKENMNINKSFSSNGNKMIENSFFNSITISALVWQSSSFTLHLTPECYSSTSSTELHKMEKQEYEELITPTTELEENDQLYHTSNNISSNSNSNNNIHYDK